MVSNGQSYIIVSYADTMWGHTGTIYQALNFLYTGATRPRTDADPGDGKHARHFYGEDRATKRKLRSSKHRYVLFIGPGRKKMKKCLAYPVLPYPKGESRRYNTTNPEPVFSDSIVARQKDDEAE
ncbi:MAG: hypothetical protein A2Y38_01210 [Spirochaetes bacterium GWB1_59_5]|nr:MAG: hypothetical protein A2Y38_01210 [Spirochaetes bacterium GWB1_59_5]